MIGPDHTEEGQDSVGTLNPRRSWRHPRGTAAAVGALLVGFSVLFCPRPCSATDRGFLTGTVKSITDGVPLPGATVYIRELGQGTSTDVDGKYRFLDVIPGLYTVEFTLIGYKIEKRQSVPIKGGDTTYLNVLLSSTVLPLGEEVVVVGRKPLLQLDVPATQRSVDVTGIQRGTVVELAEIVAAQPGVVQLENELHVRGGRTYENLYIVDGISVTDPFLRRGYGIAPSAEAIERIEIYTGGLKAEYGGATAGVVDIRTREGTPEHHGAITYKTDHFSGAAGFNTDDIALHLSGPLPLFGGLLFAGSSEFGRPTYLLDIHGRITDSYLGKANRLYSSTFGGTTPAPRQDNRYGWLAKLAWRPAKKHKLALSWGGSATINQDRSQLDTRVRAVTYSHGQPFEYSRMLDAYNTFTHLSDVQTIKWDVRPSDRTRWSFTLGRFASQLHSDVQGKHWSDYSPPVDTLPFVYELSEDSTYFTIGRGDGFYDGGCGDTWYDHHAETISLKADFSRRVRTNFTYSGGFSAERQKLQVIDIYQPWLGSGGYGLNYDIYQATTSLGAAYFQVNFNLGGTVIYLGLRGSLWFPGSYLEDAVADTSLPNITPGMCETFKRESFFFLGGRAKSWFVPRMGFSFILGPNISLFSSYSRLAQRPNPRYLYAKLTSSSQATFQLFGNPALNPEKITTMEIGIKYLLSADDAVQVVAYQKDIRDYISATVVIPDSAYLDEYYYIYFNRDLAKSTGVEFSFEKRVGNWYTGSVAATYSHAIGERSLPADILRGIRGREADLLYEEISFDWDRPWRVSVNSNFAVDGQTHPKLFGLKLPADWNVNISWWAEAGKRYTPYRDSTVMDPLYGELANYVPAGETNSKLGPYRSSLDVALQKYFDVRGYRLTVYLEAANLLDHKNVTLVNPLTGEVFRRGDQIPTGGNLFELPPVGYNLPLWEDPSRLENPRNVRMGVSFGW